MTKTVTEIAIGIIINQQQETFIAERNQESEYAGFLEFPGGKVEQGETVENALKRELNEEVGIEITHFEHFDTVMIEKPNKAIHLHFFKVFSWESEPYGKEGQQTGWIAIQELATERFPPANQSVIHKLQAI